MSNDPNYMLLKSMGARIRAARKSLKMSQETLAERANLHPTYISQMEHGKVNPSISAYDSVAKALGLTLARLVEIEDGDDDARQGQEGN